MIDTQAIRKKILDLALRGKLTEQLPEDGTAENLYKLIQNKRCEPLQFENSEVQVIDQPFQIPSNWIWVKLGNITSVFGGKRIPAGRTLTTDDTGHKYIRISDMKNHSVDINGLLFVPDDIYQTISRYIIKKEDVYITVAGTIGKIGKIPPEIDGANLTENADRLVFDYLCQDWLIYCLSSSIVQKEIELLTTQVAQPKLAIKRIQEFRIPLPPLKEQYRIAAIVKQIFALLDTIDTLKSQYQDNLATLKSKIIDAGIQGKLTEQLPEDGTAEKLYQQIQQEKLALEKAGRIKKSKPLPPISEDEKPFDIPENWKWVRLIDIIYDKPTNGFSPKGVDYPTRIKNLTLTATTSGVFKPEAYKYVDIPLDAANKYWLVKDDILIQRSNSAELVGTSCVFNGNDHEYIYPDLMMRIHVLPMVDTDYVARILKAPFTRQYYMSRASGSSGSMPKINQETVANTLVPLPPLAEQKRIVAKLEGLLPLCEG